MTTALRPVAIPTGPAVLGLLPLLRAALDGTGPGLLPGPATPTVADGTGAGSPTTSVEAAEDIALAVRTSGSTGDAKLVLLPAAALRHSAVAGQRRLHDGDPGHWLLALPADHIAGLNVLIRAAVAGREPVVLDVAQSFTVTAFAAATASLPAGPAFVSLVPTQLHRLMADPVGVDLLRRFTAVLVGGAATPPELVARSRAAGVAMVTSYGMSETCGGCVYDGVPLDGVRIGLDSQDDQGAQDGVRVGQDRQDGPATGRAAGRIRLSGPVVAAGYHGVPDGPPFDRDPLDGRRSFHTGDLGALDDGVLTVLGRADDVLITGGVNVAPLAVEHALAGCPGVAQVAVTAVPDPEWGQRLVAVVVPTGPGPDLADLRARVTTALGAAAAPRELLVIPSLPSRGPGKLDRAAVAALARRVLARDA